MIDMQKRLLEILKRDWLGILQPKETKKLVVTPDDRLVSSFAEIIDFFDTHGSEPKKDKDIIGFALTYRLEGIRHNREKKEKLLAYGRFNLLKNTQAEELQTTEDILSKDLLGLLASDYSEEIFTLKQMQKKTSQITSLAKNHVKILLNMITYLSSVKLISMLDVGKLQNSRVNSVPGRENFLFSRV